LKDETGLSRSINTFKFIDYSIRDPIGRAFSLIFGAILKRPSREEGSGDAIKSKWVCLKKISNLAFDYFDIIQKGKQKLLN
jgi:hypothetical protein